LRSGKPGGARVILRNFRVGPTVIIKRLARTLRDRDWPAIGVEVLIVVVGIVLGLQANEWHEERKLRQQESIYLSKIQDDLLAMQAELADRITLFDTSAQRMISALRALEACDSSSDAQGHVKYALEKYQASPPISFLDATYGEMVASGSLARLRDDELKRQLAQAFSALREFNGNIVNFRISLPVVDEIVWNHVNYSVDQDRGSQIAEFDMTEICQSRPMRNAVVEIIDLQRDSLSVARRTMRSVDQSLAALREYSARNVE